MLWRLYSRAALIADKRPLELKPSDYLKRNLFVTTSGQCDDVPLIAALTALGPDHVMFSVDYPYEELRHGGALSRQGGDRGRGSSKDRERQRGEPHAAQAKLAVRLWSTHNFSRARRAEGRQSAIRSGRKRL